MLPLAYDELHRLLPGLLNERANHMLTTTAVVHRTYLGLVEQSPAA